METSSRNFLAEEYGNSAKEECADFFSATVLSSSLRKQLRLWNCQSILLLLTRNLVVLSPDGRYVVLRKGENLGKNFFEVFLKISQVYIYEKEQDF